MADPVTIMAGVGLGATALGGVTSAVGNWFGGESQGAMYDYRAGIALMNKQIAEQNANYAINAGEIKAEQAGMKARYEIGQQIAGGGASGLDVRSGSKAAVTAGMYKVAQQDLGIIRTNAAKEAYGYEVEAASDQAESELDKYAAKTSRTSGQIAAIGSLLGAAGSVSSKWIGAGQAGIPGFPRIG